jgi:heme/copper-type cytochrome/quinol oxidase subunit 2
MNWLTNLTAKDIPTWVWQWLRDRIGDAGASAVQYILMTLVYGMVIFVCFLQGKKLIEFLNKRNDEDLKVRQDAKKGIQIAITTIIIVIAIGAVGCSVLFFTLNKFMGY